MKTLTALTLLVLGFTSFALAQIGPGQERKTYPTITFAVPGSNTAMASADRFVALTIESAYISHDGTPIPPDQIVDYVNRTMAENEAPYLTVNVREGITYANVVSALEALADTETKGISVNLKELPAGATVAAR